MPRQAMLWHQAKDDSADVCCDLCAHRCRIKPDGFGLCRVRRNDDGTLWSMNHDRIVAANVDPIEKKPLFHFLPGSRSMSVAAPGCNFQCGFCQNWQISQAPRDGMQLPGQSVGPGRIADAAVENDCASISYTYTEPTIFFELAWDTIEHARPRGVKSVFVSNGYMTPHAVEKIAPVLDAINVDLKAFRDETYREVMKARLEPVLDCLKALVAAGVWVEVTTLVVPGMNDSQSELADIAGFIAGDLGRTVPWHVSRFHADYRMDHTPTTPIETLQLATDLGRQAGLKHIYCGNVPGQADESTYCPACEKKLIDRTGFAIRRVDLAGNACSACGETIAGVFA